MDSRIIKKIEKMKNINIISTVINRTLIWGIVISLSISTAFAQDPTELPDGPVDEPAAPIDGYVLVLAIIGLVYVFLRIRTFVQQGNSSK